MSTQRRENRPAPARESLRGRSRSISSLAANEVCGGFRSASRSIGRLERTGNIQIPVASFDHVHASGTAAPPVALVYLHNEKAKTLGTPAATSLQSDFSSTLPVWLVAFGTCRGWPPLRAERHDARSPRKRLTGLPNQTPLPVLRVSIQPCRGYRQL